MFQKVANKSEAQKLFHQLAFKLHPDHGGSNEFMSLLIEDYEFCIKFLEYNDPEKQESPKIKKAHETISEKISINNPQASIFWMIDKYYKEFPHKRTDFFDSVFSFGIQHGYVTYKQFNALVRIYNSHNIGQYFKTPVDEETASYAQ